jgi:choline dehydrogenase-like flavoprotein
MSFEIQKKAEPWDVVVVGSGATGGWAAYQLGMKHLKVLVLEAGPDEMDFPRPRPELQSRIRRGVDRVLRRRRIQSRHQAYWELDPDLFVVDTHLPYTTPPGKRFDWIRTRSVNGRLLTWGGVGIRTSDYEFLAPAQDGFDERWPFGYAELASHFDRIDAFFGVYGERDGLPQVPDGQYVAAPRLTEAERNLQERARANLGRQVIAGRGVLVRPQSRPRGESPPPSPVREAMKRFGVGLRANAVVSHVTVDREGKATGVAFVDRITHRAEEIRARAVVLCASTLESVRILLNSSSRLHPRGLGNSSGVLGRYLMDHPAVHVGGYAPGKRDVVWDDGYGGPKNILIPRFRNLDNAAGGAFLRGYGAFGVVGRTRAAADECDADEVPLSLVSHGEMLPRFENHVSLHPARRDRWGIPILQIDCSFSDNELAMQTQMVESLRELVDAAGGRVRDPPHLYAPGGFVHEMGTARMGADPRTSVLNGYTQCWDVPNVFVMDGAAWPSGAWQNPTFTMMAIAGRGSDYLVDQFRAGNI